jgi:hypothetical protein
VLEVTETRLHTVTLRGDHTKHAKKIKKLAEAYEYVNEFSEALEEAKIEVLSHKKGEITGSTVSFGGFDTVNVEVLEYSSNFLAP